MKAKEVRSNIPPKMTNLIINLSFLTIELSPVGSSEFTVDNNYRAAAVFGTDDRINFGGSCISHAKERWPFGSR